MHRHFTQPLYTGVAHGGVGVEALGDGMTNHSLPFFFQQLDQLLLLRDQGIDLLIDLLFAANGETYESLQAHVRKLTVDGVDIHTLDIEGLLKTKTAHRDKDLIDRKALSQILAQLKAR